MVGGVVGGVIGGMVDGMIGRMISIGGVIIMISKISACFGLLLVATFKFP